MHKELLRSRISTLKGQFATDLIILGHFYVDDDVLQFADIIGDSYLLSKKASLTAAKYVIFCGVYFMAESAKILSTSEAQRVLIPDFEAGCPMASQVTAADISPDGSTIALLGYGKLWVFTDFKWDDFSKGKMKTIDLGVTTQLESICFLNNETLLLTDEERANTGGNLYSLKLKK